MNPLIKVENDTLARDMSTSALLETDVSKLKRYRAIKRLVKEKQDKIESLNDRINNLENLVNKLITKNEQGI